MMEEVRLLPFVVRLRATCTGPLGLAGDDEAAGMGEDTITSFVLRRPTAQS